MAAAIMEQRRLGLVTKAMMVVPGHYLTQASREFLLLYPNAQILVADRDAWDRHTWNRYLREAVAQEHEFGPELRRLHGKIAVLERLSSLPLAA